MLKESIFGCILIGKEKRMGNYVYLLLCSDGTYYSGWTNDPEKREKAHNSGKGSRYTRARLPVRMVYREECGNRISAMRREAQLKKLSHQEKKELAERYSEENGDS